MSSKIGKNDPCQQFFSPPASGNGDENAITSIPSNMEVETMEEADPCLDRVASCRRNG